MNNARLNEIYSDVYNILYNDKDYFYVANYKYETVEPTIKKYSADMHINDLTMTSATYVPDGATAEEYARYIVASSIQACSSSCSIR